MRCELVEEVGQTDQERKEKRGLDARFQRRTCWKMVSPAPRDGGHSQGRDTRQVYYTATEDDQARRRTEHMKKKLPHIVSSLIFKRQILLHHVVLLLI
ncbi:uncharacterized protein LOC110936474 isoform X2 [Helianthus annuus]|uniref:uncharacterized protein LOC110936474 isoform X2 n=1 Tax=Helianthus annuus TaxID=4232 RepID=UPI000B906615|nr:uncharacterized protein LOC110936474 isoform X2 [Helianthus annuus]